MSDEDATTGDDDIECVVDVPVRWIHIEGRLVTPEEWLAEP